MGLLDILGKRGRYKPVIEHIKGEFPDRRVVVRKLEEIYNNSYATGFFRREVKVVFDVYDKWWKRGEKYEAYVRWTKDNSERIDTFRYDWIE